MALVKVCGLTCSEDVTAAVDCGADALGFVFADSPRRVTAEQAAEISRDVPRDVLRVAVMLHPDAEAWEQVQSVFRPDVLQTDAGDFAALTIEAGIDCWPVCRQGFGKVAVTGSQAFVYEGAVSGQGTVVDWSIAAAVGARGRMILAGGLKPDNVADAIRTVRPWGVDASSGLECAPGKKDARLVAAYVNTARTAFADAKA